MTVAAPKKGAAAPPQTKEKTMCEALRAKREALMRAAGRLPKAAPPEKRPK